MISQLEKEIYFTLFVFSLFRRPLTAFELWQFLLKLPNKQSEKIEISEILQALENSVFLKNKIIFNNGFWTIKGRNELLLKRQETNLLIDLKQKKLKRYLQLLKYIPFLRGAFVFGSMAIGNARKESDFDLVLIAKNGRIWTLRAFTIFIFGVFFIRKRGSENNPRRTKNKICLSYFLTLNDMAYKNFDYYRAINYIFFVPVFGNRELFINFARENNWLKNYFVNFQDNFYSERSFNNFYIPKKSFFIKFIEKILSGKIGNILEKILRFFQIKRIDYSFRKIEHPEKIDRIIVSDGRLEFYPIKKDREKILEQVNIFLRNINYLVKGE